MNEEPKLPWTDLVQMSQERHLLAERLYLVSSKPTEGLAPVLANLDPHVAYQTKLEADGIMFAAGPLASDDLQEWLGEGLFVYRVESMETAQSVAERDPMHASGARSFTIREWLLNEGLSVKLFR
jgi:uncharacterized protein YciI